MTREAFEQVTQEMFDSLPDRFRSAVENVHVVVEDAETQEQRKKVGLRRNSMLLGLYEGIPLTRRGTEYGAYPVVPDKITLFQHNIETVCTTDDEVRHAIRDVLIHELGHYFGMTERDIRDAGY
jgi:predicted Zn-dependent protease with MMP-like domain